MVRLLLWFNDTPRKQQVVSVAENGLQLYKVIQLYLVSGPSELLFGRFGIARKKCRKEMRSVYTNPTALSLSSRSYTPFVMKVMSFMSATTDAKHLPTVNDGHLVLDHEEVQDVVIAEFHVKVGSHSNPCSP